MLPAPMTVLHNAGIYLRSVLRTPAPFRRHLPEAVGLWSRGARQLSAWTPHLSRSRALIDHAIDERPSRRTVAVLGSGPLFDVPLESLARTFDRVVLVDRAHLATTNRRMSRYANVERLWRDLSPAGASRPLAFLEEIDGLDWVISVNLLSQLAREAPAGDEARTIAAHLGALGALDTPVSLVTDVDFRIFCADGTLVEEADLMHGVVLPHPDSRWLWEVAPLGEEAPHTRRVHSVVGFSDWHAVKRDLVLPHPSSMVRAADPVAQQDRAWDS